MSNTYQPRSAPDELTRHDDATGLLSCFDEHRQGLPVLLRALRQWPGWILAVYERVVSRVGAGGCCHDRAAIS